MGDKPFDSKRGSALVAAAAVIAAAAACAPLRDAGSAASDTRFFIVLEQPPIIEATDQETLALARLQASRLDPARLATRPTARRVGAEELAYLQNSEAGKEFLSLRAPRAISRGSPPEICPAVGVAGGADVPTVADAATASLAACMAALDPATAGCGCRLLAVDGLLTVPRDEVAYATGTTARIRAPEIGLDGLVVAEDIGEGLTLLRDLRGPVALLRHLPEGEVEMVLVGEDDRVFAGRSFPVGFRRGRIAERIYTRDGDGREVTLLIGFSPEELAARAGAWLAGPPRG